MKDIETNQEIDLKQVYGIIKRGDDKGKYFVDVWKETYPIFNNKDIYTWICNMIDQYTDEGKESKKFSITTYLKPLQQFCNYHECTNPSELLVEKIDPRNSRVKKFLQFLQNTTDEQAQKLGFRKKPNDASIRNQVQSRIKSFYSNRGVPVSFSMKTRLTGINKNELVLDKEMIKIIKNKLESVNYKLICKLQTQLGLRISDVLEEFPKSEYSIEKYEEHYFIRNFESQKEKVIIPFLFLTSELSDLLKSITGKKDLTEIDLATLLKTRKGTPILKVDYLRRLKNIVKELGIKGNIKTHCFRKYFITQCEKISKVEGKFKDVLSGHTQGFKDAAYNKNFSNISWYYHNWINLEKIICVDCIVFDNTNKEVKKLKLDNLKKDLEIDELKKEVSDIKSILSKIETFMDAQSFIDKNKK